MEIEVAEYGITGAKDYGSAEDRFWGQCRLKHVQYNLLYVFTYDVCSFLI
jgi:hypothetical protein